MIDKEYDSSNEAWKYYQGLYNKRIKIFDLPQTDKKRVQVEFNYYINDGRVEIDAVDKGRAENGATDKRKIQLSGDCFFNFNHKKIENFKKLKLKATTCVTLEECANEHYTRHNCVLLPTTGGMNNVKGSIYSRDDVFIVHKVGRMSNSMYDRPDTFIYYIADFFDKRNKLYTLNDAGNYLQNSIFQFALQTDNFEALYEFMSAFESVYEFCDTFFLMNKDLTDKMIKNGQCPIKNEKDLIKYMKLAKSYWNYRDKFMLKNL